MTSVAARGKFRCPGCGPQEYEHKKVRRWFTLYFIPCLPLGQLGEYVECKGCKSTFEVGVIQGGPEADTQEYHLALLRAMAQMAASDGSPQESEVARALESYRAVAGQAPSRDQLQLELERAAREGVEMVGYLRQFHRIATGGEREALVKAAVEVALADGPLNALEQAYLERLGSTLELSAAHVRGIVLTAQEGS